LSTSVLHFTPRDELGPQENLNAFVELCRQSDVLSARAQFDSNAWEVSRRKGNNSVVRAIFSTLEAADHALPVPALPQPFLDFAKAAVLYLHSTRRTISPSVRIAAFRCIEAALREWNKGARPTAVNVDVLDTAVDIARNRFSPLVAYRVAGQLQLIAELMWTKKFIVLRQAWVHGLRKPSELGSRISKEALAARQEKLPSAAALRALAGIFRDAVAPVDILVSSYTALMLCAPERINEVLRLRRNCWVKGERRFSGKFGIRWSGSKLAEDSTKWLPTSMVPIAREAIEKLLTATAAAHEIAKWYTANPQTLFLHKNAAHLRDSEFLSVAEIALVLWNDESAAASARTWAKTTAKLDAMELGANKTGYRFSDVEQAVIKMLPATFPYMLGDPHLLCKDAVAVVRRNENHSSRATYFCMFDCADYNTIANALGANRDGRKTIFERFGYQQDDGSPITIRSHSLRHYLNMLAQVGGLSSAEIAIFSGRKDERQNRAYDHMTSDEVQAPITEALKAGFTGNLVPAGSRDLVTRSEFRGLGIGAAHTTEFGWCMHNFASEPCQLHRDCINCEEQDCIKGEAHKEANLRRLKDETEYLLEQAREALTEQEYGADTWVRHQLKTLDRVKSILTIMEDPAILPGSRIRLSIEGAPLITNKPTQLKSHTSVRGRKVLK